MTREFLRKLIELMDAKLAVYRAEAPSDNGLSEQIVAHEIEDELFELLDEGEDQP